MQVADGGSNIFSDPSQGPYDGSDDTLIGVVNDSTKPLGSLQLSSNTDLFGFDGDGLCTVSPAPAGCTFGPTGYEGPNTSFSNVSPDASGGVVNFTTPLAPGATAYFSLEEALSATAVFPGGPSLSEQGRGPNPSQHVTTCYAKQPINCASGVFVHEFTDFTIPGRGPALNLTRSYTSSTSSSDGPFGYGWNDSYAMNLAVDTTGLVTISQENGSTVSFRPDGSGGYIAPPRVLASLAANPDGSFTFTRRANQIRYVFSAGGQLLSETDLNGATTTLAYAGTQLATVTDPSGRALTVTYTGSHITKITDPAGRTDSYSYDTAGNLVSATDPAGRTDKFSYNPAHLLLTMTDPRGGTVTNVYNTAGQVTTQTDAKGLKTRWSYTGDPSSPAGGSTTMTDEHNNATVYNYANLELTSVVHGAGTPAAATTGYAYDAATLGRITVTDPDGHVTTNTYDNQGNLTSTTGPTGDRTAFAYNGFDEITSKTTPAGETTTLAYDGAGNLTGVTDPTGKPTGYAHADAAHPGDVTSVTDPDGRVSTLTYDRAGDLSSSSVAPTATTASTTKTVYDAVGERVCQTSPNATAAGVSCPASGATRVANTTTWTYNPDGQLVSSTDPAGHVSSTGYDANGNAIAQTDAIGNRTTTAYDPDNRPMAVTKGSGAAGAATTTTAYDLSPGASGCPTGGGVTYCSTSSDPNGHVTVDAFSARDQLLSETRPGGQTTAHRYDLAGVETARVDAAGRTTTYGHDPVNRVTTIGYSDTATHGVSYAYDGDSRRTSMTDGTGTSTYTYDPDSRLTAQTNGAGATVGYAYDGGGNITTLTYPGAKTVTRAFDGAGRLVTVTDPAGKATSFTYDKDGNPTGTVYPNGDTVASTYSATDQMASTQVAATANPNTPLLTLTTARDANDQVTKETTGGGLTGTQTFSYDAKLQLVNANGAAYNYDLAGNPTTLAAAVTQTFDAADQLTASTTNSATTTYSYDKLGNRTATRPPTGATSSYTYDQANRLTTVTGTTPVPTPAVTALTPTGGPPAGGTAVTITGTGLTGATAVTFGTQPATKITSTSDTSITATSPPGTGTVHVTVTTPAGTSVATPADQFTYTAGPPPTHKPTVTGLIPPYGRTAGDQIVLILGTHLTKVTAVHFGKKTAQFLQIAFIPGLIIAIAPAGTATVDVTVTTAAGKSAKTPADRFTYLKTKHATSKHQIALTLAAPPATPPNPIKPAAMTAAASSTATYTYNGDGLRTAKQIATNSEQFTWDVSGPHAVLLADGPISYIYGPGGSPIEQIDGSGTAVFFVHDQLGSTRALLDTSGAIINTYTYDAFGRTSATTGPIRTALLYTGAFSDGETGFYYLINRYYDPATAQFLTVDAALSFTGSPYRYVDNHPLSGIDPLGLSWDNPLSWSGKTWETIGKAAAITTVVVGAAAICIASVVCGGAVAAGLGATTLTGELGILATASTVLSATSQVATAVGAGATVFSVLQRCRSDAESCTSTGAQGILGLSFDLGTELLESRLGFFGKNILGIGHGLYETFKPGESPNEIC